jgi:hypothetical protein
MLNHAQVSLRAKRDYEEGAVGRLEVARRGLAAGASVAS